MTTKIVLLALPLLACNAPGSANPDGGVTLAPAADQALHGPVDGITCDLSEQLLFHIHAHLAIYVNDQPRLLPAGIGIGPPLEFEQGFVVGGSCFSWLHTHDQTGVIHIESPIERVYTLGNFFDVWGQPLSAGKVGPAEGTVTAFQDGQLFSGDPTTIALNAQTVVQLDVGSATPSPQPYNFPAGL